jgi:hypothetical protein
MLPSLRGLLTLREGVGLLPALLLDWGQLPPTSLCLWLGGSKETRVVQGYDHHSGRQWGDATLTGPVADQAALHGLLSKVLRDPGLPLISAIRVKPLEANASGVKQ